MPSAPGLLHIDSNESDGVLRQRWTGRAIELKPAPGLDARFAPVIERARAAGLAIEHHFEALDYFNSSFISWLIGHLRQTAAAKVKTIICFEPKSHMQSSSFDALRLLRGDNPWLEVREVHSTP